MGCACQGVRQPLWDLCARRVIWIPAEPNRGLALKRRELASVSAAHTRKSTPQAADKRSVAWKKKRMQEGMEATSRWTSTNSTA